MPLVMLRATCMGSEYCSAIHVSTMSDGYDDNQKNSVIDGVDDAIVADSKSIAVTTSKRPRSRRAWIFGKKRNCPLNSRLRRTIDPAKFS